MYNRYNRPRWRCDYAVVYAGMFTILRRRPGSLGLCLAAILFARDVCVRAVNETIKLFARPEVPRRMCVLFAGLICQSPSQSRSCPTCRYPLPGDQTTCFPRNFALEDAIAHLNEQVRPLPLFPRVTRISSQSHSPLPVWRYRFQAISCILKHTSKQHKHYKPLLCIRWHSIPYLSAAYASPVMMLIACCFLCHSNAKQGQLSKTHSKSHAKWQQR